MSKEEIRYNIQCSSVIIFGGVGFSGLNNKYNASNICYGKSFDELTRELAIEKDIQETTRFNNLYKKILESLEKNKIIILTHLKKKIGMQINTILIGYIYMDMIIVIIVKLVIRKLYMQIIKLGISPIT